MKKNYFLVTSLVLLSLSIIGFSDNLFTNIGQKSNSDPKYIIHGLFWFAWFIILLIQSNFIRKGNFKAHRKLGMLGMVAAIGVTLSTLYIFIKIYNGWDNMSEFVKASRFFLPSFSIMVLLGYLNRSNTVKHKRYMYLGTLFPLIPILDRASGRIQFGLDLVNQDLIILLIWNTLFISFFIYDWITLRKIHPITYLSFLWFYLVWVISVYS
ncbi:hypothetical protein [Algoriphagus sp.]|uniref:hypothetical protein n=1 Tax=Algoriphagus sp. TaxID=1872435 RepID=UPI0025DC85B1|nr:hypothetical protein [Algoriphagus sp.]